MLTLYRATTLADDPDARVSDVRVGGRPVVRIVMPDDAIPATYLYVLGDTMYLVQAPPDLAETLLALLP